MIERLLYDLDNPEREIFHFSELSTVETTSLLNDTVKILPSKIVAHHNGEYLEDEVFENFKTIEDFNRFFVNNRRFYIDDCELNLEDDMQIHSHDDGEVTIYMLIGYRNRSLIKDIFRIKGLSEQLLEEIMKMPGHYFSINNEGIIESVHKTFDDYLNRKK